MRAIRGGFEIEDAPVVAAQPDLVDAIRLRRKNARTRRRIFALQSDFGGEPRQHFPGKSGRTEKPCKIGGPEFEDSLVRRGRIPRHAGQPFPCQVIDPNLAMDVA